MLNHIRFLKSNRYKTIDSFILSFLLTLYLIPKFIFIETATGIDPSWRLGLNMASKEQLVWGTDIAFTFGPLGYLSTQNPIYVSDFYIVLFYFL